MKILSIIAVALIGAVEALNAQQASPIPVQLPKPIMVKAPVMSKWLITKTAAAPKAGQNAAARPVETLKTLVTKTDKIRHEATVDASGHKADTWWDGPNQISNSPEWKQAIISTKSLFDGSYVDYSKTDFPDFEWVSQANFVGTKSVEGKKCWVFSEKRSSISEESKAMLEKEGNFNPQQYQFQITAYVDSETQLPVMLAFGEDSVKYIFQPPPAEMLSLPADIKKALINVTEGQQALRRPPPKPF